MILTYNYAKDFLLEIIMESCDIIAATSAIACSIQKCYSKEETVILAKTFYQLSTTLFTMLEIDRVCEKMGEKKEETVDKVNVKVAAPDTDKKEQKKEE